MEPRTQKGRVLSPLLLCTFHDHHGLMPSGSSGDVKLKRSIVFKKRNPGDQPDAQFDNDKDAQEQRVIGRFRVKNMGSTPETYIYIYLSMSRKNMVPQYYQYLYLSVNL